MAWKYTSYSEIWLSTLLRQHPIDHTNNKSNVTTHSLKPGTHAYGNAFEQYVITEIMRLSSYMRHQYQFSYLRTINDVEVDLIIERPGKSTLYIEIKSTDEVTHDTLTFFKKITRDEKNVEALCLSNDPNQPSERELLVGVAIFSEST